MKNKLLLLCICLMVLFLSGCGGSTSNSNLDISKTSTIIEKKLDNMNDVEKSSLENVYELDLSLIDEYVIKQNESGDLYAIIKTSRKNDVKNQMNDYFEKIKEFNTAYSPERLKILENRLEKEIGSYLIYIVSEDADDIYKDILKEI